MNRHRREDVNISDTASLVALGVNNPKEFNRSIRKFRVPVRKEKIDLEEMKKAGAAVGMRVPG